MVVFFDIDGTIVDDDTQIIPESAIRAVERLGEKGHLAVVNTGRPYSHIDPRVREMAFGAWICGCGMEIRLRDGWLVRRAPEEALCRLVRDAVRACGMMAMYESRDGALLTDGKFSENEKIALEAERMRAKGFQVLPLGDPPRFMKLVTYDGPDCRREEFVRRVSPWFDCTDRGNTMLELVLKGCSKAGGMEELLMRLGLPREETLAIGDSTNDLPMIEFAAHGACMGGGMDKLKERAEFVTAPVLEDGVEKALKHFGLI